MEKSTVVGVVITALILGLLMGDAMFLRSPGTPQRVSVGAVPAPLTTRVRKYEFDNGSAIAEYDLGRFRCFELLSRSEVRFACAAH